MELVRVEIITKALKMDILKDALLKYHISGVTILKAQGCGVQYGVPEYMDGNKDAIQLLDNILVMIVMPKAHVEGFILYVEKALYTGHIGDGKIFVSDVLNAYRVRTGEESGDALVEGKF